MLILSGDTARGKVTSRRTMNIHSLMPHAHLRFIFFGTCVRILVLRFCHFTRILIMHCVLLFSSSHCVPVLSHSVVSAHHPLAFSSFFCFMVCFPCVFIDLYFAFFALCLISFVLTLCFLSFWLIFCNHFNSLDYDSTVLGQIRGLYSLTTQFLTTMFSISACCV